jgi:hypothetical protein
MPVATAATALHAGRTGVIKLTLTRAGRLLLEHAKRSRLVVTGVFTPVNGPDTVAREPLFLTR